MTFQSFRQPFCRHCGKKIAKQTESVYVVDRDSKYRSAYGRSIIVPERLHSKEECQRHSNKQVVFVEYTQDWKDGKLDMTTRRIHRFAEWDGSSYKDEFFCSGDCARLFGYLAARSGKVSSVAYNDAIREQQGRKAS